MADERRAENFSKLFFVRPERNAMGKKDVYTRPYFADKKRFADFINVHLYGGKEIVMEGALVKIRLREVLRERKAGMFSWSMKSSGCAMA